MSVLTRGKAIHLGLYTISFFRQGKKSLPENRRGYRFSEGVLRTIINEKNNNISKYFKNCPLRLSIILSANSIKMQDNKGKTISKTNLPSKTCLVCNKPFSWRKKWAKCWNEVKYCSDRCRNTKL